MSLALDEMVLACAQKTPALYEAFMGFERQQKWSCMKSLWSLHRTQVALDRPQRMHSEKMQTI